jgi:lipid II:glycine glycyltransferase (peptidoglycan interpeptide bridge formation enzyme)
MASTLMMWEVIKFGKKLGLSKFDMWGALSKNPDPKDPWFGFHRFKQGFGPEHVEFIGSYDLVINPWQYQLYKIADKARWAMLKFKKS